MIRIALIGLIAIGFAGSPVSAQGAGDAAKGKTIFQQQCGICHQVGPNAHNTIGPVLNGVYDAKPAAVPGFNFSPAMKEAAKKGIVWNDANLNKFLENPQGFIPGTTMPYAGLPNATERADVIAYLKTLKS
ncbi:MAG: cytochrome c family protein [Rhodomicrobium sp.]